MSKSNPLTTQPRQKPEKQFGPFARGLGVAIWLNTTETDEGPKQFRSITIAPRRYQVRETGEWKDAGSFNPGDLPALIFALTKAQEYCFVQPLPGQQSAADNGESDEIPY